MFVYCDNAATTAVCPAALEAMLPFFRESYGNASSMYKHARAAKTALENARRTIASCLGVLPEEIFFTSGGTEADNWALKSAVERGGDRRRHIVVSAIEHHAVAHTAAYMEKRGVPVTTLSVDSQGFVSPAALRTALREDTAICSVMAANNEIGTILPVADYASIVKGNDMKILFHTDAVQAIGHIRFSITPEIDLVSISAHKLGGPKGIGALYCKKGVVLPPLLHGGGHERGRRSSTENVAGAVGMAAALQYNMSRLDEHADRSRALRDQLISGILTRIPYSHLTGAEGDRRLPGNASFVFEAVEGESLVLGLDALGVCVSSGSACSSASLDPSHVLLAIGLPHEVAHGSVRLTISPENTPDEMEYVISSVEKTVARCREMSPLWDSNHPTERFWKS